MALFPECPLFQGSSVLYRHDENMKYVCSYQLQHLLLSLFLIAIIPLSTNPTFKHQPHKLVKHTQTIRQQFADKLFECV